MLSNQFRHFAEARPPLRSVFHPSSAPVRHIRSHNAAPQLVACVDDTEQAGAVSAQALAIACSLGLEVTFARVIEAPDHFASPADPVEWQLRRRAQSETLRKFADRDEDEVLANSVLLAGVPADELSDWAQDHGATMLAMGRGRSEKAGSLGSTAHALLERADHSLLLVPSGPPGKGGYRRIMVPIDGSARSDSVLPIALRIARTHAADLILAHVVPRVDVLGAHRSSQVEHLCTQIDAHNKRNADHHLEELSKRSIEDNVEISTIIRGPGDPRALLLDLAVEEQADLIVMASHGNTGLEDVACGSVTEYFARHAPVPILIVRPNIRCSFGSEPADCRDASAFRFEE